MRFAVAALGMACAMSVPAADARHRLGLTPDEQVAFLAEMRVMLGSVQGIDQGIADGDRAAIARFASESGKRMARATPPAIVAKLPPAFAAIGEPTHLMFDELAVRAETDDMDMLTRQLAQTLRQCMACHAAFTVR
jgi:hypothetical protein